MRFGPAVWSVTSLAAAGILSGTVLAEPPSRFRVGTYVTEGGWGTLKLKAGKGAALSFTIDAEGTNGHTCGLGGEIPPGQTRVSLPAGDVPCVIELEPRKTGIEVSTPDEEACRYFCGMRAYFTGLYEKTDPACYPKTVRDQRAAFKRAYAKKDYAEAERVLSAVLSQCDRQLGWETKAWVQNDLAVTVHHLGDDARCLALLQPLAETAAMTDAEIEQDFPPAEAEVTLRIARATRANLHLCKGSAK